MSQDAYRLPGAEFPHDNPALFEGAAWVVVHPCDNPRPLVRARPGDLHYPTLVSAGEATKLEAPHPGCSAPEAEPAPALVTEPGVREPDRASPPADAGPPASEPDPVGDLERFIAAVVSVASQAGATRLAGELKRFFEGGPLRVAALPETSQRALLASGLASMSACGPVLAPHALGTARAWRCALAGVSQDFADCGDTTLDTWAAEFVGACLGFDPAQVERLRRALRREGVAAFGMLAA